MISGANEEELELAGARMDIMLATNYTTENPGPLAIIDKYHDKEIERLNNIINELEKWLKNEISYWEKDYETLMCSNKVIYLEEVLDKLKELKEGK